MMHRALHSRILSRQTSSPLVFVVHRELSTLPLLNNKETETLKLKDGRTLSYSDMGDPSGPTVINLHGYPGCRFEGPALSKLANTRHRLKARIITPDRPGIGLSSPHTGRRLRDYPHDVLELADHLGLDKLSIVGGSGGGPYAVACARYMPTERLKSVGVLAGFGRFRPEWVREQRWANRVGIPLLVRNAWLARPLLDFTVGRVARGDRERARRWLQVNMKRIFRDEAGVIEREPEAVELVLNLFMEHFRQGAAGWLEDGRVLMEDWGFELEEVPFRGVKLWYGTEDKNTPVVMGRMLARGLPDAKLTEFEGETHLTLMDRHGEEILRDILYV
ncbi:alpha/beta-hydrolase [Meredithblackwellia eburnea MCA 4105]